MNAPDHGTELRPFRRANIPAYLAVMGATVGVGLVAAAIGYALVDQPADGLRKATIAAGLIGAFGGMSVMFTASLLNLRKLLPGFQRLARGEEPRIPPVWCPVLTTATAAAERLADGRSTGAPPHPQPEEVSDERES